mmetsp:Transcript_92061/g.143573  ORF Transcript_92061/g.143573 Transcript_92061/m.143573 type:complete len:1205 (-) Transcript_92061:119-3733(-)
MDIAPDDDLAVRFGAQILQGQKQSLLKGNKNLQDGGGLLIGTRDLVVVSIDSGSETIPVKLVDHGAQQKEATRRLFEAHVHAQSFQQEVVDKNEYIAALQAKIKNLEEELIASGVARVPVEPAMDLTKLKLKTAAVERVPQWLRNDQHSREIVVHFTNEIMEDGPSSRKALSDQLWMLMQATVHRWAGGPDQLVALQAKAAEKRARETLHKSLRESSEIRSHFKDLERKYQELYRQHSQLQRDSLTRPSLSNGSGRGRHELGLEGNAVASFSGPQAHAGVGGTAGNNFSVGGASQSSYDTFSSSHDPISNGITENSSTGDVNQINNVIGGQSGNDGIDRSSGGVMESSNLPNHGRAFRTSEFWNSGADATIEGCRRNAPSSNQVNRGDAIANQGLLQNSPLNQANRGNPMARQASASSKRVNTSGGNRSNDKHHSPHRSTGNAPFDGNIVASDKGVGIAGSSPNSKGGSRKKDNRVSFMSWGGQHHDVELDPEKLDTMDNEVFEPLSCFDDDLKKLLIDVVDEKVKRILLLDPEKFDGRLPYGIKPITSDNELIKQLKEENEDLKSNNSALEEEIKRMKATIEQLRKTMQEMREAKRAGSLSNLQESALETDTCEFGKTWADEDVQAAIAAALAKLSEEHLKQVAQLQDLLNKANSDLDAALKEAALANKRAADLQAQLDASLIEIERLKKELERLGENARRSGDVTHGEAGEKMITPEKAVGKISEKVVKEVDREAAVSLHRMQVMTHMLLKTVGELTKSKHATKHSSTIEDIIGKSQDLNFKAIAGGARDKLFRSDEDVKPHQRIVDVFADWCQDIVASVSEYKNLAPGPIIDPTQHGLKDDVDTASLDQQMEIDRLRKTCREQQEEISRLLLMIEELRLRLAQMQQLLEEKGGPVADELEKALVEVGLKDLIDAKQGNLKNVYERLYQDALQRMQRLALTLEQKAEASKMYYQNVKKETGFSMNLESLPLQRLTEAALAAIHGMFYHYDILFRRVCERAAADGLRNAAIENYRLALSDIFGDLPKDSNFNDLNSICITNACEPFSNDRIQQCRGAPKPRICNSAGALTANLVAPNAQPYKSKSKQGGLGFGQQREAGAFQAYMSKLQQLDAQANPLESLRSRPASRTDSLGALTQSLKRSQLTSSLSLPALPKGFASMKVVLPDVIGSLPNSAASHKTSLGGLASHESSLMLQDSWMSSEC